MSLTLPPTRTPRMGRTARRAQVLETAQQLFARLGYHQVSMDDIAEAAGVSKPVLYRHFPSKLDLYVAVVDERAQALLAAVQESLAEVREGAHPRGVTAAIVRAYLEFADAAGQSASLLFESDATRDDVVGARLVDTTTQITARIARELTDMGPMDPQEALLTAHAFVATSKGAALYRLHATDAPDLERTVQMVSRLTWAGVAGVLRDASGTAS
ncbi:MAG: TetR/AcrR family transcriptional regulator [Cellulomonas sp.]|nr:TetR/AcrR family transcriptional regulator [Cellulomonas sp.]